MLWILTLTYYEFIRPFGNQIEKLADFHNYKMGLNGLGLRIDTGFHPSMALGQLFHYEKNNHPLWQCWEEYWVT